MDFDNENFQTNPNLVFQETVAENADYLCASCNFEVIKNKNDNKTYIAFSYFSFDDQLNHELRIISLEDKKIVKKLTGHNDRILAIRHFLDEKTQKDFLVSVDRKYHVIIWDIYDDYKLVKDIEVKYDAFIYSFLLIFKDETTYLLTSSIANQSVVKIIDIKKDEAPRDIQCTKDFIVYYMEYWKNKNDNKDYVILCGSSNIKILLPFENRIVKEFDTTNKFIYNLHGLICKINDTEYFVSTCKEGIIKYINLDKMEEEETKEVDGARFRNVFKWNEKYLLVIDAYFRRIGVIDVRSKELVSRMVFDELKFPRYMKKVNHPVFGESILINSDDFTIKLYSNRNIAKFKD